MTCRFEEVIQELEVFLEDTISTKTGKVKSNYQRKLQLLKKAELHRKKLVSAAVLQKAPSVESTASSKPKTSSGIGFQGYVGGFDPRGKSTPEGDGKDKAMREVADGFVGEFSKSTPSSTLTSYLDKDDQATHHVSMKFLEANTSKSVTHSASVLSFNTVMLARNGSLAGKPLEYTTKLSIKQYSEKGATFVVGDMPNVDTQFIEYLNEIGASYKVYTTNASGKEFDRKGVDGSKYRDMVASYTESKSEKTYEVSTKGDKRFSALVARLNDGRTIEEAFQLDIKGYRESASDKDWKKGKGKPPKDTSLDLEKEYEKLWRQYFDENPKLLDEITKIVKDGNKLTDKFAGRGVNQARTITNIVNSSVTTTPNKKLDYTAYAKELIGAIKTKNNVVPIQSKKMAIRILKDVSNAAYATAYPDGSIAYADFDAVLADPRTIQGIAKYRKVTEDQVITRANEEKDSFFVGMTRVHEHIHIGSVKFMKENPDAPETRYVKKLYAKVQKFAKENPGHRVNQIQNKYWDKDVYEFVAVSLSNPEMVEFLGSVGLSMDESVTPKNPILKILVGKLLSILGVKDSPKLVEGLMTSLMNMNEGTEPKAVNDTNGSTSSVPMTLNEEQQVVYTDMIKFFEGNEKKFVLDAAGGTGKTYTVGKVAEVLEAKGKDIGYLAPTHAAKEVLTESTGKKAMTIASALAYRLNERTGEFVPDPYEEPNISSGAYIIVDESSMLTESMYEALMDAVGPEGKVVFMGDRAQLPPIRTPRDKVRSKSETSPALDHYKVSTLTKVMRFDGESKIGDITTKLRTNSLSGKPTIATNLLSDLHPSGNVGVVNDVDAALLEFVQDAKSNPMGSVMITYNNEVHTGSESVKTLNARARKLLKPEYTNEYVDGDVIVAYATLGSNEDGIKASNSSRLEVSNVKKPKRKTYSWTHRRKDYSWTGMTQEVTLSNGNRVEIMTPSEQVKFSAMTQSFSRNNWPQFWANEALFTNKLLKAEFGYAITSHKSQGQSYDNVTVMLDNIDRQGNATLKAKAASTYVAMSRPKKKLTISSRELRAGNTSGNNQSAEVKPEGSHLQDGDEVKVFSQFVVQGGPLAGKHITYHFNPQNYVSMEGPKELVKEDSKVKAYITGKYSDEKMTYYTVELDIDGKRVSTQEDGVRPLHITERVAEGVKPFETGLHAEQNPEMIKPVKEREILVRSAVFKAKYNSEYDRSRKNIVRSAGSNQKPATISVIINNAIGCK